MQAVWYRPVWLQLTGNRTDNQIFKRCFLLSSKTHTHRADLLSTYETVSLLRMSAGCVSHEKKACCWKRKKKRGKGPGRRGETEATWGPVNRLVLNSNNVGNSKHFSRSKRKPQSPGCLCSLCSLGLTGGRWAGWHHRTAGSRAGVGTQTNTDNLSPFWRWKMRKSGQPRGLVMTSSSWVCCWAVGDWCSLSLAWEPDQPPPHQRSCFINVLIWLKKQWLRVSGVF